MRVGIIIRVIDTNNKQVIAICVLCRLLFCKESGSLMHLNKTRGKYADLSRCSSSRWRRASNPLVGSSMAIIEMRGRPTILLDRVKLGPHLVDELDERQGA